MTPQPAPAPNKPFLPTANALGTLVSSAALGAALIGVFATDGARAEEGPRPGIISVTGIGKKEAAPDMGVINLAVLEEAKTARDALDANNRKMAEVMTALKTQGIEDKDMQTSNFSIQQKLEHYPPRQNEPQRPPKVVGYQVFNQLTVRIRQLDKIGAILDKAVTLGVNDVSNIRFANADPDSLTRQARALAMADAMDRAKTLTEKAGVCLGRITAISEGRIAQPRPYAMQMSAKVAESAPAVPMAQGENSYLITVNASWEIAKCP